MADAAVQHSHSSAQTYDAVRATYDHWDQERLRCLQNTVDSRQWELVRWLPALLHCQVDGLPGLVSTDTPSGIAGLQTADAARMMQHDWAAHGLHMVEAAIDQSAIHCLFIETAATQLVSSLAADQLNITVICRASLPMHQQRLLQQKLEAIQTFASDLGWQLSWELYCVGASLAHAHSLTDSLFSRTVLLCGERPTMQLRAPAGSKQALPPEQLPSTIDLGFGAVAHDDLLLFGAHRYLSESMLAPYRAMHGLVWIEATINQHPKVCSASESLRTTVWRQPDDIQNLPFALDADFLLMQKAELYLQALDDQLRLNDLRACFLQLLADIGEPAAGLYDHLVAQWQLPAVSIESLAPAVTQQLLSSYSLCCGYVQSDSRRQWFVSALEQLQTSLSALYVPGFGKLNWPGYTSTGNDIAQSPVFDFDKNWRMFVGRKCIDTDNDLLTLLTRAAYRGYALLEADFSALPASVVSTISPILPALAHISPLSAGVGVRGIRSAELLIVANLEHPSNSSTTGAQSLAMNSASAFDVNGKSHVVQRLSVLCTGLNGEVVCREFSGPAGLLNGVGFCVSQLAVYPDAGLTVLAGDPAAEQVVASRVRALISDLHGCFHQSHYGSNARYVMQLRQQFFIVHKDGLHLQFKGARSESELIRRLGAPRHGYSPVVLDRDANIDRHFAVVFQAMEPGNIQVFYYLTAEDQAQVVVVDELGAIFTHSMHYRSEAGLMSPLDEFLQAIVQRRRHARLTREDLSLDATYESARQLAIRYYRIDPAAKGSSPALVNVQLSAGGDYRPHLQVQAIGQRQNDGTLTFNLWCDRQLFLAADWEDELYPAVARFIMARRKSRERYACRLSDVDLSCLQVDNDGNPVQTIDFLRAKNTIETAINDALARV
ncbi:Uncharacterised protein [BD1-7 clade bacterium]|uniref:Adenylate cyclase class-I N-terminal domain-containing protein n=1 Tax=BD1-7 clade bacterium TaxID=2029982 RepID=A0A5S9Q989_9GAMM|nr:Uncharacterised protein [BD1-7 clade bacterium]